MTSPDNVVMVGNDPLTTVPLGKLFPANCCWPPARPVKSITRDVSRDSTSVREKSPRVTDEEIV